MGVTYKLSQDVIEFILQQRRANALLSCRALAEGVEAKFGTHLSKSSVHEVLKEANIASNRGRKPKDGFTIPPKKKDSIKEELAKALLPLIGEAALSSLPAIEIPPQVIAPLVESALPVVVQMPISQKMVSEDIPRDAGVIFLKAIFWDLCPNSILGIKGFEEIDAVKPGDLDGQWPYLSTLISAIKITLEDGGFYYIDARSHCLSGQNPGPTVLGVPIERGIQKAVDFILNNSRPLIVGEITNSNAVFDDFLASFRGQVGKKIRKIEIVDEKDHIYVDFSHIVDKERHFIVENSDNVDISLSKLQAQEIAKLREAYKAFGDEAKGGQALSGRIKQRAKAIFASQWPQHWEEIYGFAGKQELNDKIRVVTLFLPELYNNKQDLQIAADLLNRLRVEDEQGRLLQLKLGS